MEKLYAYKPSSSNGWWCVGTKAHKTADNSTGVATLYGDEARKWAPTLAAAPELLKMLRLAAEWMEWWLGEEYCECDGHHICGRDEREKELRQIKTIIKKVEVSHLMPLVCNECGRELHEVCVVYTPENMYFCDTGCLMDWLKDQEIVREVE